MNVIKTLNFHERARANIAGGVTADMLYEICFRHYDKQLVNVYDVRDSDGDFRKTPYRIHIRTDIIKPDLICDLEEAGLECQKGTTCNEWETSILIKPNPQIAVHPPHMVVKLDHVPAELQKLTPLWYQFLNNVEFLGHLMGTMSNGIQVPKQAFGECQTSIVLETYRRAYGPAYKSHQCIDCVNFELGFKQKIVDHDFNGFQADLNAFVTHFINIHPEAYTQVSTAPFSYKPDYSGNGNITWFDSSGHAVVQNKGRYSNGYL